MTKSSSPQKKEDEGCCSWLCCCRAFLVIFIIVGLLLSALGVFLVLRYRFIFNSMLAQKMPLSNTSATFASFKNPPAEMFMAYRFFNLTNPDEFTNGSKPIMVEIGPYVYRNRREKSSIEFNDEGTEVFYEERKFYEFVPEKSVGSENDTFYNLDLVAYGVTKAAYDDNKITLLAKTLAVTKRNYPFKAHRVGEFLFGGKDNLLEKVLPLKFPDAKTRPPAVFGIMIDKATGKSKSGLIDANYTLHTGKGNLSRIHTVVNYNDMTRYPDMWPESVKNPASGLIVDPNMIHGTLGTGFPPGVKKETVLTAFAADLCLSIDFTYNSPSKVGGDVDTMRFMVDVPNWRKFVGDLNREVCPEADRNDPQKCMQDGILNATACKGAALMMSLPHFMDADPYYQGLVGGLQPDESKHSIFLDIDPLTGAVLNAAKRMQVNIRVMPFKFRSYTNLPWTLLPIMWIEESGGITPVGLQGLKERVHGGYHMLRNIAYILLIVGIAILPITIVIFLVYKQRHNANKEQYDVQMTHVNAYSTAPSGKRQGDGTVDEKQHFRV